MKEEANGEKKETITTDSGGKHSEGESSQTENDKDEVKRSSTVLNMNKLNWGMEVDEVIATFPKFDLKAEESNHKEYISIEENRFIHTKCVEKDQLVLNFSDHKLNEMYYDLELNEQCNVGEPEVADFTNSGFNELYQVILDDFDPINVNKKIEEDVFSKNWRNANSGFLLGFLADSSKVKSELSGKLFIKQLEQGKSVVQQDAIPQDDESEEQKFVTYMNENITLKLLKTSENKGVVQLDVASRLDYQVDNVYDSSVKFQDGKWKFTVAEPGAQSDLKEEENVWGHVGTGSFEISGDIAMLSFDYIDGQGSYGDEVQELKEMK